jgi:hypothetical protein
MRAFRWLAPALLSAIAPAAQASTFLALSHDELIAGSAAVVEARVAKVESFWNHEHTTILTEATVHVDRVVVGEAPEVVRVRTFGGTVGRYRIEAPGFPTFGSGERLLLFLYREPADGSIRVQGYQLGQYRIEVDARGIEMAVPKADAGVVLLSRDGKTVALPRARPLAELEAGLREIGERQGRRVP